MHVVMITQHNSVMWSMIMFINALKRMILQRSGCGIGMTRFPIAAALEHDKILNYHADFYTFWPAKNNGTRNTRILKHFKNIYEMP